MIMNGLIIGRRLLKSSKLKYVLLKNYRVDVIYEHKDKTYIIEAVY